jgi:hypothetical protein
VCSEIGIIVDEEGALLKYYVLNQSIDEGERLGFNRKV